MKVIHVLAIVFMFTVAVYTINAGLSYINVAGNEVLDIGRLLVGAIMFFIGVLLFIAALMFLIYVSTWC